MFHWTSTWVSYITGKLWYVAVQQYTLYICNIGISVKVALLVIPSAANGPSSCLWYDEWCTKHPVENLISLESCDMQLFNSIYYILVTLVYQSKQPVQWSLVHQMDNLTFCDQMSGPLIFLLSILHDWKVWYAAFKWYILYICNLSISVKAVLPGTPGTTNGPSGCLWYDEWSTKLPVKYLTSLESVICSFPTV